MTTKSKRLSVFVGLVVMASAVAIAMLYSETATLIMAGCVVAIAILIFCWTIAEMIVGEVK